MSKMNWYYGTHEQYKELEGLDTNYVTCSSEQAAQDYIYKFEEVDKNKKVDHVRVTKGINNEDVYYVYYKYIEEES